MSTTREILKEEIYTNFKYAMFACTFFFWISIQLLIGLVYGFDLWNVILIKNASKLIIQIKKYAAINSF